MSSSSVCQGLQSCLEPRVIEPRVLRLKLAPPGSKFSPPSPSSYQEKGSTGWSFLEALTDNNTSNCNNNKTTENKDQVYVHPTVKCSSSMLSEKSLEMCTESLGSETGSNASESNDDVSLFSFDATRLDDTVNTNLGCASRRANNNNNKAAWSSFPPPLTSITDFGGVHVKPHREGGRLILEAVASPSPTPYFHAEREDGRLRLHLFEGVYGSSSEYDDDDDDDEEEDEEEEEGEEEEKEGCEEELEEYCAEKVEDEMGVAKFARPSRCKEGGNRDIFGDGYFELPSLSLCL